MRIKVVLSLLVVFILALASSKRLPIAMGLDGNPHFHWDATVVAMRRPFGSSVTRMYFPPQQPITFMDPYFLVAVRDVGTRVHALIGTSDYEVSPTDYANYCMAVVQRFGPRGSFWAAHPELNKAKFAIKSVELLNEPYFIAPFNPAKYAAYIKPALLSLARLKSGVAVIVGTSNYARTKGNLWLDTLYRKIPKLNSLVAGFATHPYWNGHQPDEKGNKKAKVQSPFIRLDWLRANINCHGGRTKGIYITEYGASTAVASGQGVTEAGQARALATFLRRVTANTHGWNVRMCLLYTLQDWAKPDPANRESMFGIVRGDGSLKPAYGTVLKYLRVTTIPSRATIKPFQKLPAIAKKCPRNA